MMSFIGTPYKRPLRKPQKESGLLNRVLDLLPGSVSSVANALTPSALAGWLDSPQHPGTSGTGVARVQGLPLTIEHRPLMGNGKLGISGSPSLGTRSRSTVRNGPSCLPSDWDDGGDNCLDGGLSGGEVNGDVETQHLTRWETARSELGDEDKDAYSRLPRSSRQGMSPTKHPEHVDGGSSWKQLKLGNRSNLGTSLHVETNELDIPSQLDHSTSHSNHFPPSESGVDPGRNRAMPRSTGASNLNRQQTPRTGANRPLINSTPASLSPSGRRVRIEDGNDEDEFGAGGTEDNLERSESSFSKGSGVFGASPHWSGSSPSRSGLGLGTDHTPPVRSDVSDRFVGETSYVGRMPHRSGRAMDDRESGSSSYLGIIPDRGRERAAADGRRASVANTFSPRFMATTAALRKRQLPEHSPGLPSTKRLKHDSPALSPFMRPSSRSSDGSVTSTSLTRKLLMELDRLKTPVMDARRLNDELVSNAEINSRSSSRMGSSVASGPPTEGLVIPTQARLIPRLALFSRPRPDPPFRLPSQSSPMVSGDANHDISTNNKKSGYFESSSGGGGKLRAPRRARREGSNVFSARAKRLEEDSVESGDSDSDGEDVPDYSGIQLLASAANSTPKPGSLLSKSAGNSSPEFKFAQPVVVADISPGSLRKSKSEPYKMSEKGSPQGFSFGLSGNSDVGTSAFIRNPESNNKKSPSAGASNSSAKEPRGFVFNPTPRSASHSPFNSSEKDSPVKPKSSGKNESDWRCSVCMIANPSRATKCLACETKFSDVASSTPKSASNVGIDWRCSVCMVSNPTDRAKCLACETPKPKSPSKGPSSNPGEAQKIADWCCPICFVKNPASCAHCPCCATKRPASATKEAEPDVPSGLLASSGAPGVSFGATVSSTLSETSRANSFMPQDSWTCNTCYVYNSKERKSCAACGEPKPDTDYKIVALKPSRRTGSPSVSSTLNDSASSAFGSKKSVTFAADLPGSSSHETFGFQPSAPVSGLSFMNPASSVFGSTSAVAATPSPFQFGQSGSIEGKDTSGMTLSGGFPFGQSSIATSSAGSPSVPALSPSGSTLVISSSATTSSNSSNLPTGGFGIFGRSASPKTAAISPSISVFSSGNSNSSALVADVIGLTGTAVGANTNLPVPSTSSVFGNFTGDPASAAGKTIGSSVFGAQIGPTIQPSLANTAGNSFPVFPSAAQMNNPGTSSRTDGQPSSVSGNLFGSMVSNNNSPSGGTSSAAATPASFAFGASAAHSFASPVISAVPPLAAISQSTAGATGTSLFGAPTQYPFGSHVPASMSNAAPMASSAGARASIPTLTSQAGGLFGGSTARSLASTTTSSLFGGSSTAAGGSWFGGPSTAPVSSISVSSAIQQPLNASTAAAPFSFGSGVTKAPTATSPPQPSAAFLFGGPATSVSGVPTLASSSSTPVFGGGHGVSANKRSFTSDAAAVGGSSSVNSGTSNGPIFGGSGLFGGDKSDGDAPAAKQSMFMFGGSGGQSQSSTNAISNTSSVNGPVGGALSVTSSPFGGGTNQISAGISGGGLFGSIGGTQQPPPANIGNPSGGNIFGSGLGAAAAGAVNAGGVGGGFGTAAGAPMVFNPTVPATFSFNGTNSNNSIPPMGGPAVAPQFGGFAGANSGMSAGPFQFGSGTTGAVGLPTFGSAFNGPAQPAGGLQFSASNPNTANANPAGGQPGAPILFNAGINSRRVLKGRRTGRR